MRDGYRWGVCVGLAVTVAVGCYRLVGAHHVMSSAPSWTGAGHASFGSTYFGGYAIGLAGEDIHAFQGSTHIPYESPLVDELGPGYTLTSIAQTHSMGFHENTFVHGYPASNENALDLFLFPGFHFANTPARYRADSSFAVGSTAYTVRKICDMAASDKSEYGSPSDPDSFLFLSVIACRTSNPAACTGAVVEVNFTPATLRWGVKSRGGSAQAVMRTPGGAAFDNECMPISATGLGGSNHHYLVVADPSRDEVAMFRAGALHSGPTSSFRTSSVSVIKDIVVEGRAQGTVDYQFVQVLWRNGVESTMEHWLATNGRLSTAPFIEDEDLSDGVAFIHTTGAGGAPAGDAADVFEFGANVFRRAYERN